MDADQGLSLHSLDDENKSKPKRRPSLIVAQQPSFVLTLFAILVVTVSMPAACLHSSMCNVIDDGSGLTAISGHVQVLLSGPMVFLLITHVRALWHVPQWTKHWNIVVDFGTSAMATLLRPNAWGLSYVLMHSGFFLLRIVAPLHFRALFAVKDIISSPIYFGATCFEILFQLNHLRIHGALLPVVLGFVAFIVLWHFEEKGTRSMHRTSSDKNLIATILVAGPPELNGS